MSSLQLSTQAMAVLTDKFGAVATTEAPARLSEATRRLAARYLAGEIGAAMRRAEFSLEQQALELPLATRYAETIALIARHAPLRIDAEERLVGAATLREASWHETPASSIPRAPVSTNVDQPAVHGLSGTSHVTIDYEKLLRVGYGGLRAQILARRARGGLSEEQATYLSAMLACLDAAQVWHGRHVVALEELRDSLEDEQLHDVDALLAAMRRVPEAPPSTFHEALQCLWFAWTFQRLCGNWTGLGRVDKMLGPFLRRDLDAGLLTLEQARELLAHFWIKGCEWIGAPMSYGAGYSGDAQFYQNVILGGVDEQGNEVANEVTYLILDVVEELHISDYPIAVRVSERTPEALWRAIARIQRLGGGIVAIYNEDLVIRALTRFGFPLEEARNFTNDGCWEVLIPGKSAFSYRPFDTLALLQQVLGQHETSDPAHFASFEELYRAFHARLAEELATIAAQAEHCFDNAQMTAPLLSLLVDDCIETARDYHQRGAHYSFQAPHAGGLPDVANSLHVIKQAVFIDHRVSFAELIAMLRADWVGHEECRRQLARDYLLYGNADPQADAMLRRVFDDYVALAARHHKCGGVLCPPGISTFGREIEWRENRLATAFGRPAHAILAGNLSPTPGTERRGVTAVVNSYCTMDFEKLPNGVPLDITLSPSCLSGEDGLSALTAILHTFIRLGGWYLQVNVLDQETLREAQRHPELFPNLTVRISGWSARFATLDPKWQEMVIQRTVQGF